MIQKLKEFRTELEKINEQRTLWLYASAAVILGVVLIIAGWHYLQDLQMLWIFWTIISTGLIVSVIWWYWTMRMIRYSLNHQLTILDLLVEMTDDIKLVKKDVEVLFKPVDKDK